MQMVENGTPSRPAGQNGRPADKEQKRLGELWRTIDTVVDAALRGDESALRELETTLRRVVSTANRVARPGGEQAEPAPAAAADSAQS